MAFNDSPKFTNKGKQLMAAAIAGEITLKFVNIRLGDGERTTQAMASLTDLINPIVSLSINSIARGSNYVTLQTDFSNADLSAGFYWREIGVYAEDPEGGDDILYCYGNCGELAEYIAAAGEQVIKKIISMSVIVGDAENVTAEITDAVYYSPQDPLQDEISKEDLIPFFAQLAGKKNITFEQFFKAIYGLLGIVSAESDGLCPKYGGTKTKFLRDDGIWAIPPDTTYEVVSTTANGLCPKRGGTTTKFLRDDGTWAVPPDTNTTYGVVTSSANGLMTPALLAKLNGIATGATKVTVLTGALPLTTGSVQTVTLGVKPKFVLFFSTAVADSSTRSWIAKSTAGGHANITITSTGFNFTHTSNANPTQYYFAIA